MAHSNNFARKAKLLSQAEKGEKGKRKEQDVQMIRYTKKEDCKACTVDVSFPSKFLLVSIAAPRKTRACLSV